MTANRAILTSCLVLGLLSVSPTARAAIEQLPPAPAGFSWREFKAIHGALLVPDGWFVREEIGGGMRALFISKESTERGGRFRTGLTVNVFSVAKPSAFAGQMMAQETAQANQSWGIGPIHSGDGVQGFFRAAVPEYTLIKSVLILWNGATGTVYYCIFEAPEADWGKPGSLFDHQQPETMQGGIYRIGAIIFSHLWIDPAF